MPLLGDDERGLAGGLADDHAALVGDGDSLKAEVAAEDGDMQGHARQIFGRGGVLAVQLSGDGSGDLAVNSGPGAFYGPGIRRAFGRLRTKPESDPARSNEDAMDASGT
jgi:hypothetical protein